MNRVPISEELRQQVFERDHFRCRYCGRTRLPLQADHVYPASKGGETTLANLVTSCQKCNLKKSNAVGIWPQPIRSESQPRSSLGLIMIVIGVQVAALFFADSKPDFGIQPQHFIFIGLGFVLFGAWLQDNNV